MNAWQLANEMAQWPLVAISQPAGWLANESIWYHCPVLVPLLLTISTKYIFSIWYPLLVFLPTVISTVICWHQCGLAVADWQPLVYLSMYLIIINISILSEEMTIHCVCDYCIEVTDVKYLLLTLFFSLCLCLSCWKWNDWSWWPSDVFYWWLLCVMTDLTCSDIHYCW